MLWLCTGSSKRFACSIASLRQLCPSSTSCVRQQGTSACREQCRAAPGEGGEVANGGRHVAYGIAAQVQLLE